MPLSPAEKVAAQNHLPRCEAAQDTFEVVVAAGGVAALVGGVLVPYAAVAALLTAILRRHVGRVRRAANDPPRQDYERATRVRLPGIDPAVALEGNPLRSVALPAARDLLKTTGNLSAFVRAVERADGARLSGARARSVAHTAEAARFAGATSRESRNASASLSAIVAAFSERLLELPKLPRFPSIIEETWPSEVLSAETEPGKSRRIRLEHVPLDAFLPPEQVTRLRRAGVRDADVVRRRELLEGTTHDFPASLEALAESLTALATAFEGRG